ncbi:MAG: hypothetical protein HY343_06125 [Lentisphaerae bacterium]|nr:hypothetical protein [Lentisphaerota bacterium]
MTKTKIMVVAVGVIVLAVSAFAGDMTPDEIFEKVKTTYGSMQTYKAEGTITTDSDTGGKTMKMETSFSMLLKKPNCYLISWTQKDMPMPGISHSGTVWSDSTQPYLYTGRPDDGGPPCPPDSRRGATPLVYRLLRGKRCAAGMVRWRRPSRTCRTVARTADREPDQPVVGQPVSGPMHRIGTTTTGFGWCCLADPPSPRLWRDRALVHVWKM